MDDWSTWLTFAVWIPAILYMVWFRRQLPDLGSPKLLTLRWSLDVTIVVGCLIVVATIFELLYF